MRERINAALKEATLAQEKRRVATLRLIKAAIKDRDIADRTSGKDAVGDEGILQILAKMVKQREESAVTYEQAGRLDLVEQERDEIEIISEFLPKQLNDEEIEQACSSCVAELGSTSLKDMGKTMNVLKERYAGKMDFSKASKVVKRSLGG